MTTDEAIEVRPAAPGEVGHFAPDLEGSPARCYEVSLPWELSSPGRARAFAAGVGRLEHLEEETLDLVRLVVSELVTNSVVHGASEAALVLLVGAQVVIGQVSDRGVGMPRLLEAPLGADSGRGLAVVAAVASGWGTEIRPSGKSVWFRLPRPSPRVSR